MDPIIGSTLIKGATSLLGGALGFKQSNDEMKFNAREAEKNRQFQTSERLAAQDYNTHMWNLNNEYNSIGSQLQRAVDAGLNPNSFLSGSNPSATAHAPTTSPMSGNSASYSSSLSSSLLSSFAQNALMMAQVEKTESETDNNRYALSWNKMTEEQRYEQLVNLNAKAKADIAKVFSDIGMNDFSKDLQEKTFRFFARKSEAEIKVMNEQLNVLRNQNLDILKGIDLKDSQIKVNEAMVGNINSSTAVNQSQVEVNNSTVANLDSRTSGQQNENALLELKKKYSEATGIPIDAPESHVMFTLWAKGLHQELSDKIMVNDMADANSFMKGWHSVGARVNFGLEKNLNALKELFGYKVQNPQLKSLMNP